MDAQQLFSLPRAQLQKLARSNGIKANMKSADIIARLCEMHPGGVPSPQMNGNVKGRKPPTAVVFAQDFIPTDASTPRMIRTQNKQGNATSPSTYPVVAFPPPALPALPPVLPASPRPVPAAPPTVPIAQQTPPPRASPELLERMVETMRQISADTRAAAARLPAIRAKTKALQEKVDTQRAILRAERAMRLRIEAYLANYTPVAPEWEPMDIWGGQIIKEKYTEGDGWREIESGDDEEYDRLDRSQWPDALGPNQLQQRTVLMENKQYDPFPHYRYSPQQKTSRDHSSSPTHPPANPPTGYKRERPDDDEDVDAPLTKRLAKNPESARQVNALSSDNPELEQSHALTKRDIWATRLPGLTAEAWKQLAESRAAGRTPRPPSRQPSVPLLYKRVSQISSVRSAVGMDFILCSCKLKEEYIELEVHFLSFEFQAREVQISDNSKDHLIATSQLPGTLYFNSRCLHFKPLSYELPLHLSLNMSAYGTITIANRPTATLPATSWKLPAPSAHKPTSPFTHLNLYHLTLPAASAVPGLVEYTHTVFAEEVERGATYPQETLLAGAYTRETFDAYFWAADVFVAIGTSEGRGSVEDQGVEVEGGIDAARAGRSWEECLVGFYYVKPNYPGRSSHICNAGFVIAPPHRRYGYGKTLGRSYLHCAPKLGFKASVFNLVYTTNIGSMRIWDALGFTRAGLIPRAGRLRRADGQGEEWVDAVVYYRSFIEEDEWANIPQA
ncbi:hypothetical protein BV25DRAFT_1902453 [Artomyces pyxidatus]|uniref:Uncharacterized protein n=1 Tax=Artomyces pyxidatus TaxID=48021 RepID=A0ACB8SN53_9AGAM|nr:hypothetical protein BV25DRAFT_1902453 [Artomyces pyxidatus]